MVFRRQDIASASVAAFFRETRLQLWSAASETRHDVVKSRTFPKILNI